jgi:hypothetical protein
MDLEYSISDSLVDEGDGVGMDYAVRVLVEAAHAAWSPGTYVAKTIGESVGRGIEHALAAHLASALRPACVVLLLGVVAAAAAWRSRSRSWHRSARRRGAPAVSDEDAPSWRRALELDARATSLEAENRQLAGCRLAAACRKEHMRQIETQLLLQPPPPVAPLELEYLAAVEEDDAGPPDAGPLVDAGVLSELSRVARSRRGGLVRKTAVLAFLTARGLPHALYERVRLEASLRTLEHEVASST